MRPHPAGVMVDCHGYPVELCREVVLDLTPDPCACETEPARSAS